MREKTAEICSMKEVQALECACGPASLTYWWNEAGTAVVGVDKASNKHDQRSNVVPLDLTIKPNQKPLHEAIRTQGDLEKGLVGGAFVGLPQERAR